MGGRLRAGRWLTAKSASGTDLLSEAAGFCYPNRDMPVAVSAPLRLPLRGAASMEWPVLGTPRDDRGAVPDGASREACHRLGEVLAPRIATGGSLRDTKELGHFGEPGKTRWRPHPGKPKAESGEAKPSSL
jgi:hypothetical protein